MAITYTWEVTSIKVKDEGSFTNAVVQTYWKKTGTDENGNEGTFSGATPFSTDNMPEGNTFVPFAELTEEMVLEWIKDVVVNDYERHVNEQIAKQIRDKTTPVTEAALPWKPAPEAVTPPTPGDPAPV
jgi:hypothetical protein